MRTARRLSLLTAAMAAAVLVFGVVAVTSASAATIPSSAAAGTTLPTGAKLQSVGGVYTLMVQTDGNLVMYGPHGATWATGTRGSEARLVVQTDGNLVLYAGKTVLWKTDSWGSGSSNVLSVATDGVLALTNSHGTVWSSQYGYGCGARSEYHGIEISLSRQLAWFCDQGMQELVSPITSGASSLGDGTPTGTWRIQAKIRDTYLHPAGGGSYFVHYWMPYDGAYGMHDSPWQTFPYGSSLYRTEGSHGCIHLPGSVAAWVFGWAPVGTTVAIKS